MIGIDPKTNKKTKPGHSHSAGLRTRNRLAALTAAIVLAVPATAAAAGPTASSSPANTQYASGPSGLSGAGGAGEGGGAASASSSGSLPFTGFDAGLLAAIGVGLVASGALLHRRQRTSGEQA